MCYPKYYHKPFRWAHRGSWSKPRATYNFDEEKNVYEFYIELPGISKNGIDIKAATDHFRVEAKEKPEDKKLYYRRRFDFYRKIDPKNISAKYENGMLTVTVPLQEKSETFNVEIN
ncbi:MAG: Hsp20/alpha crystallin family protein [Candidatus Hodarchaeota archaeon]